MKRRILFWIEKRKFRKMKKEMYDALISHFLKMKANAKLELEAMPHVNGGYVSVIYNSRKKEINKIISQCDKQIRIARKLRRELK